MPYSIVVVTWECADYLAALVESMNRHLDGSQELVVVDNASSDEPRSSAARWKGDVRHIQRETNEGFGRASNIGVREARHDIAVLLNPDILLVDESLDALARAASELGGLVGPRVLNPDRSIQPSASGSPVGIWPWVNAFVPGALMPAWMQARTEPWRLDRSAPVAWLTGACIAAPRDVLVELGPFDESIEMYGEDLELGLRASKSGVPSHFRPRVCRIIHCQDGSSRLRYVDAGRSVSAQNRRIAVARAHGLRAERLAWRAELVKLRLRVWAKGILGCPRDDTRDVLAAMSGTRPPYDVDEEAEEPSSRRSRRSTVGT